MANPRISVPEDHIALILPDQLAQELFALMLIIRQHKGMEPAERAIAADVIVRVMEATHG